MRRQVLAGALGGLVALSAEAFILPLRPPAAGPCTVFTTATIAPAAASIRARAAAAAAASSSSWRLAAAYDEEAASSVLGAAGMESPEQGDQDQDGVSLRRLQDPQAEAAFLEEQVTKWLDQEWIPQDCHRDVARVAASTYVKVGACSLARCACIARPPTHPVNAPLFNPWWSGSRGGDGGPDVHSAGGGHHVGDGRHGRRLR